MTSPNPTPGAAPEASDRANRAAAAAMNGVAVPLNPNGTGSKYGLGKNGSNPINLGNVPFPRSGDLTVEQATDAFAQIGKSNPQLASNLQAQLQAGGFYKNGTFQPLYGMITTEARRAFAAAATAASNTAVPLSDFLGAMQKYGDLNGLAAAIKQRQKSGAKAIVQADPNLLGSLIDEEFKKALGHKPSPAERAGFVAAYNSVFAQQQRDDAAALVTTAAPLSPEQQGAADFYASTPDGVKQRADAARGEPAADSSFNMSADPRITALGEKVSTVPVPPDPNLLLQGEGGSVVQHTNLDASSFAENYARNSHPDEAGAHDITNQFANFMSLLGGIR